MIEFSVISSASADGGARRPFRTSATRSGRSGSRRCLADRLTAIGIGRQTRGAAHSFSTLSINSIVSGSMRPVCSARPTNSSGPSSPCAGCCHRASASILHHLIGLQAHDGLVMARRIDRRSIASRSSVVSAETTVGLVDRDRRVDGHAKTTALRDIHRDVRLLQHRIRGVPCSGNAAMPMLALTTNGRSWITYGSFKRFSTLPAIVVARCVSVLSSITANSSPPSRATVSLSRTRARRRAPTSWSIRSPA